MIDIHCHILPGIDDGAKDLVDALEMARIAEEESISIIVATPHYNLETGLPTPAQVRQYTARFNENLHDAGIKLQVVPGMEVPLTPDLPDMIRKHKVLSLGDTRRFVLIELPFTGIPNYLGDVLFKIQLAGLTPIIAHPERSGLYKTQPREIENCMERGALLQVNIGSVVGYEGREVASWVQQLARSNKLWAIATDAHDTERRPPRFSSISGGQKPRNLLSRLLTGPAAIDRIGGAEVFEKLTQINPARVLLPR